MHPQKIGLTGPPLSPRAGCQFYQDPDVAYYDKTYFFDLEADTLDLGSLDHEKEKCFWNFFHILQKDPYQVQITFCHLYSES